MGRRLIIFLNLVLIFQSAIAFAGTIYTREFKKTVDFQPNKMVEVKTINGKIDLTSWDENSVEIEAEIKVKASSNREAEEMLDQVEILIEQSHNGLTVEPNFLKRNQVDSFWDSIFGKSKPVVNFAIKVPKETDLKLKSTNGHINVDNIIGELTLGTTNGGIEAEDIEGSVEGHTTNGSISMWIDRFREDDRIDLSTTNGSIKLRLPSDVRADLKVSTVNGSIRTDFPMTVQGKFNRKRLNGEINGGGGHIDLSTVNGSVSIYER